MRGNLLGLKEMEHERTKYLALFLVLSQNDQSTGEIKVIGGDDLSTLTGKVGVIQTTEFVSQCLTKVNFAL